MNFPSNLHYTKDHEWIRIENNIGTVGITDFAQSELGDVVFVELPKQGRTLKQHETFGTIEAVKAVSDLFSPVSGEVMEINTTLEATAELVNKSPYDNGWIIKIKLSNVQELSGLLSADQYRALVGK
ncbi:MAG: glycine cleavage system protein GcvH [Bacteroidota bacterium]